MRTRNINSFLLSQLIIKSFLLCYSIKRNQRIGIMLQHNNIADTTIMSHHKNSLMNYYYA